MDETKLAEFNTELKALLIKYDVNLQVQHNYVVVPRTKEEVKDGEPKAE